MATTRSNSGAASLAHRAASGGTHTPPGRPSPSPFTVDVDLELWNPSGTKVAQATGTSSKPETLGYTVPSGGTGTHTLKVLSKGF